MKRVLCCLITTLVTVSFAGLVFAQEATTGMGPADNPTKTPRRDSYTQPSPSPDATPKKAKKHKKAKKAKKSTTDTTAPTGGPTDNGMGNPNQPGTTTPGQ